MTGGGTYDGLCILITGYVDCAENPWLNCWFPDPNEFKLELVVPVEPVEKSENPVEKSASPPKPEL